jgi:hypothetical protein
MDPKVQDVIAAFADGEPVTAEELRASLASEDGRDYLIDLLAIRGLIRPCGAEDIARGSGPADEADAAASMSAPRSPRLVWAAAAAALVAVSTLAGFSAGRMTQADVAPDAPTITVLAAPPPAFLIDVPAPTRVIQLKHGQDWNEQSGGN